MAAAWLLTEEGTVNGVFGDRRARRSDSIWTIQIPMGRSRSLMFLVEGEIGVVESDRKILHVYNTRTGEVFEPAQMLLYLNGSWYSLADITETWHRLYDAPRE